MVATIMTEKCREQLRELAQYFYLTGGIIDIWVKKRAIQNVQDIIGFISGNGACYEILAVEDLFDILKKVSDEDITKIPTTNFIKVMNLSKESIDMLKTEVAI